jgi:hypothetical protein
MNYKIKITAENQAIVKRIADENGMADFYIRFAVGLEYLIENGVFPKICNHRLTHIELTTEQFIEMFDKKETELDKWLKETKAKNLSEIEIYKLLFSQIECPDNIHDELKKQFNCYTQNALSKLLYEKWNNPTEQNPKVETEQRKIIGYKAPFDIGGHKVKNDLFEKANCEKGKWYIHNYVENKQLNTIILPSEWVETWDPVFEPLPIEQPKETDFKSQVIDLIEKRIAICIESIEEYKKLNSFSSCEVWRNCKHENQELLKQIKEL